MKKIKFIILLLILHFLGFCQKIKKEDDTSNHIEKKDIHSLLSICYHKKNKEYLEKLYSDNTYTVLRDSIFNMFRNVSPGNWGEFVKGVNKKANINQKIIALTFDACGGPNGSKYDEELIQYLQKEQIPATLFITGKWIDANCEIFKKLSQNTLFEIENHGLNHLPCSIEGRKAYGIKGTANVSEVFDEMEANARKIREITGYSPQFYRSGTAFIDEASVKIAETLHLSVINYDVLSGDAVPYTPAEKIKKNVLSNVKPGSIIIMHFNHPEWNTYEALVQIIPILKQKGYSFTTLKDLYSKK